MTEKIYIHMIDGTDIWVPVDALRQADNQFLLQTFDDFDTEDTNDERISYLLGTWVCFGKIDSGQYSITIRRSDDKFKLILNSLKELGCDIVKSDSEVHTDIDTKKSFIESQTVTFKPIDNLADEIKKFTGLVGRLEKKRLVFYNSS